ncbi:MAG: iron-containing redox enzyme family protein [Sandaracinaceae bacterium]|nr:iron-containing redox enzyme family protein [Sandaracinaceae bacterium]
MRGPRVPLLAHVDVVAPAAFDDAVEAVARAYDFAHHPYFVWAWASSTSRAAFRHSQTGFRFAVAGWGQALAAVLARTPRLELRRGVARNLADEVGASPELSHEASFERYLRALGATDAELGAPCPIAVRAFSEATTNFALAHPYAAGAAALGIIEHVYIGISADIGALVTERGFAAPGSQDHYAVHEALDVEHARDLFELARPAWSDARGREEVALGLELGAHLFWQLYLDLLPGD